MADAVATHGGTALLGQGLDRAGLGLAPTPGEQGADGDDIGGTPVEGLGDPVRGRQQVEVDLLLDEDLDAALVGGDAVGLLEPEPHPDHVVKGEEVVLPLPLGLYQSLGEVGRDLRRGQVDGGHGSLPMLLGTRLVPSEIRT